MSLSDPAIRPVGPEDLPVFMKAMAALASDLGDPFNARDEMMAEALFGAQAHSGAFLARSGPAPLGAVLFSPFVSTGLGHACLYVSDLWVAASMRGQALGRRLLAAAATNGAKRWQTKALYLTVYAENTGAQAFYRHLGFDLNETDKRARLHGAPLAALIEGAAP